MRRSRKRGRRGSALLNPATLIYKENKGWVAFVGNGRHRGRVTGIMHRSEAVAASVGLRKHVLGEVRGFYKAGVYGVS